LIILTIVVLAALTHTVLAAGYFYLDDGIKSIHKAAENIAFHDERMKNLERAEQVLEKAASMRNKKQKLADRFGGADGRAAIELLLRQFGDADGDGIPDIIDPIDNRTGKPFQRQFAQQGQQVKEKHDDSPQ
jgi:hypothetical protein